MTTAEKIERVFVTDWEERTEARLREYPSLINRIAMLEIELEKSTYPSAVLTTNYEGVKVFNLNGLGTVSKEEVEYNDKVSEIRVLNEVISKLKVDEKVIITERYINEKDQEEICTLLNISKPTYYRRKKEALSYIADWLGMKYTYSDMIQS